MKTVTATTDLASVSEFASYHGFGVLIAVGLAVACAWVLAERWDFG